MRAAVTAGCSTAVALSSLINAAPGPPKGGLQIILKEVRDRDRLAGREQTLGCSSMAGASFTRGFS